MWGGTYNSPTQRWLASNPGKLRYNPATGTYQAGYNDPQTNEWKWGADPASRFGGGGGAASGGAAAGVPSAAGGVAGGPAGVATTAATTGGKMGWVGPAIMGGASLVGTAASAKGGKNAQDKQDARIGNAQDVINKYLAKVGDWQGELAKMFPELASGKIPMLESTQSTSGSEYSAPDFGENKGVADMLTQRYANEVRRGTGLPSGTLEGRMRNVNDTYALQSQQERNALARKGLALPAGAMTSTDRARQGTILDTENQYQNDDRAAKIQNEQLLQSWLDAIKGTRRRYSSSSKATTPFTDIFGYLKPEKPDILV